MDLEDFMLGSNRRGPIKKKKKKKKQNMPVAFCSIPGPAGNDAGSVLDIQVTNDN